MLRGSPLRVRGKVHLCGVVRCLFGITPACAGKSSSGLASACGSGDHPRVCGEKFNLKEMSKTLLGSPPRMQGKDIFPDGLPCAVRITPACAGKSLWCAQGQAQERDHPRVCEEKNFLLLMTSRRSGSPPRVRGKGQEPSESHPLPGITPACAGKRKSRRSMGKI